MADYDNTPGFAAATRMGRRDYNQDAYVCHPGCGLWLVADGIGGLSQGEAASAIIAHSLTTMVCAGEGVNQSIESAHRRVREYADEYGKNMGAALVLLYSTGTLFNVFWAGDSRAYHFRREEQRLELLTVDHTHLQYLIDNGEISAEDAQSDYRKHGLTKAVGIRELQSVRADSVAARWQHGSKILLCSDGLSGSVDDATITDIMRRHQSDSEIANALVDLAYEQGSTDNITAIVISAPQYLSDAADDDTEIPSRAVLDRIGEKPAR